MNLCVFTECFFIFNKFKNIFFKNWFVWLPLPLFKFMRECAYGIWSEPVKDLFLIQREASNINKVNGWKNHFLFFFDTRFRRNKTTCLEINKDQWKAKLTFFLVYLLLRTADGDGNFLIVSSKVSIMHASIVIVSWQQWR